MNAMISPKTGRGRRIPVRIAGTLAAVVCVLTASRVPAVPNLRPAEARGAELRADRWYVIKIAGNPAGFIHEQVESKAAPEVKTQPSPQAKTTPPSRLLVTTSDMRIVLNRLGSRIELRFFSSSTESAEGLLLGTSYVMLASNQSTKSDSVVGDGKIEVTSEAGGKTYRTTLTFKGKLFGPEAIGRACAEGLKKAGEKITIQTFIPEAGLVGNLTRVVLGRENIVIEGKTVPALKVEETFEGMPIKRTGWLDLEGTLLKQEEPGPFGVMEVVRSEKGPALAAASGAELPTEIYLKSIVRTNIRLPKYAPIDRLKLKLTHRNPALGWPDFKTGNQTALEKSEKVLTLEIRRPARPKSMTYPVAADAQNRQFLEPNAYIQSDEKEIRSLAQELEGTEKDAFKTALAMERWVAEHMTFDLGIVFAPASEIFRNRRGTCVGYATILATLARAVGIPSRVAMGYVYAEGMFGGHAWTEILAGKEWVPLDAAIVNEGVADSTHLAIIASSLVNGPGEMSIGAAQQVFGQVDIAVLEYETAGKTTVVPKDAKPFAVEGNRYANPWLGIILTKPADLAFAKLDAIWPDPTVVGLTGANGLKAALQELPVYPWQELEKAAADRLAALVPKGKSGALTIGEGAEGAKSNGAVGRNAANNNFPLSAIGAGKEISPHQVPAIYSADGKTAAAAFGKGAVLFVLRVDGPGAADLLRQLAAGFRFD